MPVYFCLVSDKILLENPHTVPMRQVLKYYILSLFFRRENMAEMMWAGRFSKQVDAGVNAFNSSIAFDGRMYRHDIQGSIAHATMLGDCGIVTREDSLTMISGLK